MGRLGKPREIGVSICFLASPAASYMTGQHIVADGGLICEQFPGMRNLNI